MQNEIIYLDHNATTPVDLRVLDAMMPYLTHEFANANSTHVFGVKANDAVKKARNQVAGLIGAEAHEIVFTSGATEAINAAIKGVAENYGAKGKHLITVKTEHSAVLDVCQYLQKKGFEISYLDVDNQGLINLTELQSQLRSDTILVSVMLANNETGVIQPIKQIAELAHKAGALFMSDTTQAVGKIPVNVDEMGIDLLCMSGHKVYAPKGVGALYVRQRGNRVKLPSLLHGGGHERGMRSGTLNVPGIVAIGHACALAMQEMSDNEKHIKSLRDYLETELLKIENTQINGTTKNRLYNTSNILFKGADSDAIIMGLSQNEDLPVIAVSNGSACTSTRIEPSHVLTAMGLDETDAYSCLRFSLGKNNSKEAIALVIEQIKKVVGDLRAMIL
ncbi:aminotransferase class V-fold PLP-dependent enzyme [bacterium]|nr:aminotransferase class V-fold PLP-dependent enzyme [bacterium]